MSAPAAIQARDYQLKCLERIKMGNTIINMPTGTGKTYVAVLAIEHFRPHGKTMFVVPTRPLVKQQADYVRDNADATVAELGDSPSQEQWHRQMQHCDVFVGTGEVFRRALVDNGYIKLDAFSLVIFDECHNATGNSSMTGIMRDAWHRCEAGSRPRILALTASFVNGKLEDIEEKRRELEGLLQSKIFCPDVDARHTDYETVDFEETMTQDMKDVVTSGINDVLGIAIAAGVKLEDSKSTKQRAIHTLEELGADGVVHYINALVVPQLEGKIEEMGSANAKASIAKLKKVASEFVDGSLMTVPRLSNKAQKLMELLRRILDEHQGSSPPRIIVFCEQIVLAVPMALSIDREVRRSAAACTGNTGMTDSNREEVLKAFRSGKTPILTCTAAVEEGLDVSSCEVVVRFSKVKTTKSHIQGAGRARAWNARVFYFDNDPDVERNRAELLERVAKKEELSLTEDQLEERRAHKDVEGVHPYKTETGAEISVFNCTQMVNEYVSKCMLQTFRPEENMCNYEEDVVCQCPRQVRKRLVEMEVPSPDGFFKVTVEDVDRYWGEFDVSDVADGGRIRNWKTKDKESRRFYFVVAVTLSKKGYLAPNNLPSSRAVNHTRHVCPAWTVSQGASLNLHFDSGVRRPAPAADGVGAAASTTQQNFKGRLNELTNFQARYETVEEGSGFRSTVVLPDGTRFSCPSAATSKMKAEQAAAQEALRQGQGRSMPRQPPPPGASAPTTRAAESDRNWKMELNNKTGGSAKYDTVPEGDKFRSTVILSDGTSFAGQARSSKKEAEQQAAAAAVNAMSQPRQPKTAEPAPAESPSLATANGHAGAGAEGARAGNSEIGWASAVCRGTKTLPTDGVSRLEDPASGGAVFHSLGVLRDGTKGDFGANGAHASSRLQDPTPVGAAFQSQGVVRNDVQGDLAARPADAPGTSYQSPGVVRVEPEEDAGVDEKTKLSYLTQGRAKYSTRLAPVGGYFATVTLPDGREFASPAPALQKKAAEAAAARGALMAFEDTGGAVPQTMDSSANFKGTLNEITNAGATYSTDQVPGGWRTSVQLRDGRRFDGPIVGGSKKAAEQAAAKVALLDLAPDRVEEELQPEFYREPPAPGSDVQGGAPALAAQLQAHLRENGRVLVNDLVRHCGTSKKEVNQQLYALQARGLAKKVQESPPMWEQVP